MLERRISLGASTEGQKSGQTASRSSLLDLSTIRRPRRIHKPNARARPAHTDPVRNTSTRSASMTSTPIAPAWPLRSTYAASTSTNAVRRFLPVSTAAPRLANRAPNAGTPQLMASSTAKSRPPACRYGVLPTTNFWAVNARKARAERRRRTIPGRHQTPAVVGKHASQFTPTCARNGRWEGRRSRLLRRAKTEQVRRLVRRPPPSGYEQLAAARAHTSRQESGMVGYESPRDHGLGHNQYRAYKALAEYTVLRLETPEGCQ